MRTARSGLHGTRLGLVAVMAPVVGWSFANVIVKIVHLSALEFAFYRLWLGAGAMLVLLAAWGRRPTWPMIRASIPGGVLFGLNIVLFFSALRRTNVADVLVIQSLQPALIMLVAGRLFGERATRREAGWAALSVAGVVVFVIGSSGTPSFGLKGDLLAVAALFAWTGYFLVSKRVRRDVLAIEYMSTVTLTAAVVVTPIALAAGSGVHGPRWQDWLWLGLFVTGAQGGHILLAWAHSQVDVSLSSLLILAEPVFSAVAALVVLGEPITVLEIAGGVVAIAGVAAIARRATVTEGLPAPGPQAPPE